MKKLSLLVLALFCCTLGVLAANNIDIIVKTNSEKIEALIQEVSETELRFKKANNPNGPTFSNSHAFGVAVSNSFLLLEL